VIAIDYPAELAPLRDGLAKVGTPVVAISVFDSDEFDCVTVDLESGTREALTAFLNAGKRRIAYLTDVGGAMVRDPRYRAYNAFVNELGLDAFFIECGAISRECAFDAVMSALHSENRPDALLCRNDILAIGAYRAIKQFGLGMPDDIALIGCDATPDTAYFDTPISSIGMPIEEAARHAWSFLKNRMADSDLPAQRVVLKSALIERESSK